MRERLSRLVAAWLTMAAVVASGSATAAVGQVGSPPPPACESVADPALGAPPFARCEEVEQGSGDPEPATDEPPQEPATDEPPLEPAGPEPLPGPTGQEPTGGVSEEHGAGDPSSGGPGGGQGPPVHVCDLAAPPAVAAPPFEDCEGPIEEPPEGEGPIEEPSEGEGPPEDSTGDPGGGGQGPPAHVCDLAAPPALAAPPFEDCEGTEEPSEDEGPIEEPSDEQGPGDAPSGGPGGGQGPAAHVCDRVAVPATAAPPLRDCPRPAQESADPGESGPPSHVCEAALPGPGAPPPPCEWEPAPPSEGLPPACDVESPLTAEDCLPEASAAGGGEGAVLTSVHHPAPTPAPTPVPQPLALEPPAAGEPASDRISDGGGQEPSPPSDLPPRVSRGGGEPVPEVPLLDRSLAALSLVPAIGEVLHLLAGPGRVEVAGLLLAAGAGARSAAPHLALPAVGLSAAVAGSLLVGLRRRGQRPLPAPRTGSRRGRGPVKRGSSRAVGMGLWVLGSRDR